MILLRLAVSLDLGPSMAAPNALVVELEVAGLDPVLSRGHTRATSLEGAIVRAEGSGSDLTLTIEVPPATAGAMRDAVASIVEQHRREGLLATEPVGGEPTMVRVEREGKPPVLITASPLDTTAEPAAPSVVAPGLAILDAASAAADVIRRERGRPERPRAEGVPRNFSLAAVEASIERVESAGGPLSDAARADRELAAELGRRALQSIAEGVTLVMPAPTGPAATRVVRHYALGPDEAPRLPHLADALGEVPSRPHGPGDGVELTPWMAGALAAMREATSRVAHAEAGVDPLEPPCPYGSGSHRAHHEIIARREWLMRAEYLPLSITTVRVAAVLVSGGAADYAAYMAVAEHDEFVADHGTKLRFDDAALLFPGITKARYRH